MTGPDRYDAIIIGAGQGGGPLSGALAKAGRRTALIEREHVGGACVNDGCTPTKTMVASARVAYLARRAADYGVRTASVQVDMAKVRQRKRAIVERFRSGSERAIRGTQNLDLVLGDGRFVDARTVDVTLNAGGTRRLTAELIVIDTGQRPFVPPIPGLAELRPLDSTTVMELDEVPEHLIVLGGGSVGIEFGQMFRRFGSAVTMIEMSERLLPHEDEDIAEAVAGVLREDEIELLTGATPVSAAAGPGGSRELRVHVAGADRTVAGSHILAAAGRVPNSDGLNLAAAGVRVNEHGYIPVNERLETNVAGIYAIGDVNGELAFTHVSYDDYRILKANLLENGSRTTSGRLIPYTIFLDPQLGRVGLTEEAARRQGTTIRVATMPMSHVARALEVDESRGLMKVVIDAGSDRILGAAVLGIEGGEIMAMLQLSMMGGLTAAQLKDAIFAHPTLAEALNNLFS